MAVSRFACVCVCMPRGGANGTVVVTELKRIHKIQAVSEHLRRTSSGFKPCFLAAQIPWKIKRVELCTYRAMSQTAVLWNQRRAMCPTIPCSAWRWTARR